MLRCALRIISICGDGRAAAPCNRASQPSSARLLATTCLSTTQAGHRHNSNPGPQ